MADFGLRVGMSPGVLLACILRVIVVISGLSPPPPNILLNVKKAVYKVPYATIPFSEYINFYSILSFLGTADSLHIHIHAYHHFSYDRSSTKVGLALAAFPPPRPSHQEKVASFSLMFKAVTTPLSFSPGTRCISWYKLEIIF